MNNTHKKTLADRLKNLSEQQLRNMCDMLADQKVPVEITPPEVMEEVERRAKLGVRNLIERYLDNTEQPLIIVPDGIIR